MVVFPLAALILSTMILVVQSVFSSLALYRRPKILNQVVAYVLAESIRQGLAAMYPLYVPPSAEEGAYGERILPRWINDHCKVTAPGPGNLAAAGKEGRCFELMIQVNDPWCSL